MQNSSFQFLSGGEELLPMVENLWWKLKDFHVEQFPIWSESLRDGQFGDRVQGLLEASHEGALLVEIAHVDETPIAFCLSVINKDGVGELASLFVDEPHRNHGIALRLVESSLQWLKEHQASPIVVDVMAGNSAALKLYERLGFAQRVNRLQLAEDKG